MLVLVGIWSAADSFLKNRALQAVDACLRAARRDTDPEIPLRAAAAPFRALNPLAGAGTPESARPG